MVGTRLMGFVSYMSEGHIRATNDKGKATTVAVWRNVVIKGTTNQAPVKEDFGDFNEI
jgi:hypothetical protein